MRQTSYVWNELVENGEFHMDAVARIYGATGTDPDAVSGSDSDGSYREYFKITSPVINRSLLSGNILSIGNCVSGTLTFSIMTTDNIPKSAKIKIMGRVTDGNIEEGNVLSHAGDKIKSHQDDYLSYINDNPRGCDWLTFGTFWIDHRTVDDDFIDLECYDAMKMGNQLYDDPTPSAQWPRAVSTIVTRIAQQIGVSIDSRTTKYFSESGLWGQKIVTMPTSDTLNDILGHIGGILGGNWYITEENKLRYIPLISAPVDAGHILSHANDKITTDQGDYIIHGSIRTREADRDGGHITSHANDKIISHVGDYIMWETLSGLNTIVNLGGTGCVVVPVIVGSMTTADSVSVTRVTVSVNADTTYTYGTDDGFELIVSENPYATDALTAALYERVKGVVYSPYNITTAVYNPATELGDWVIAGDVVSSTIFTQNIRIGIGFDADISAPSENELENEFPYKTIEQKVTEKIETTETTLRQETVSAVESATNQITGANGSQIQFLYDENKIMKEIVIMDTNSTKTAQKVWRWNGNGFGYSKNGYNGPYGLAITQDGAIVADFLTVGIIKSPTNADTFWNLSKGELKIKGTGDTSPAIHVKTYMDGDVEKTKTEINADKITTGTFNADGNSVKIRGKLTDWNNNSGNYWNLDTGDFQVKGSSDANYAIKVSGGKTDINANNITTGTLKNKNNNNNYWNLTNGTFKVQGANDNSAAIEVNNSGKAIINASYITTGTLDVENRITTGAINKSKLSTAVQSSIDGAAKSEQIIYYSKATNSGTPSAQTTWVTDATGEQNKWTTTRPVYSSSYPLLFTAKQSQTVAQSQAGNNECTCTTPVLDQTTTVIDGGRITTGQINAGLVKVGRLETLINNRSLNYWDLQTGDFQVKGSSDSDYAIKVSNGKTNINADNITVGTISPNAISNNSIPNAKLSGTAQGGLANRNQWQINFNTGNITIGDISANSVVTGEIKNESNRNNYWNLNTGELKVGSTESSSDYAIKVERLTNQQGNYYWVTNINADKITTGEIKNKNNRNNYWNLNTGEFRLGSTESSSDYAIKVERKQDQQGNYYWTTDINANSIKAGELKNKDNRYNYWNLDNGTFRIGGSGTNDYAIKIDDDGVVKVNALKVDGTVSSAQTITENLSATKIKGGTLTLGGTDGGNYKNGSLELYDSNNKLFGRWDRNGLSIGKWDSVSKSLLESFSVASNTGNVTITDGVLQNIVTGQYGTETKSSILKIDGATIYGGEYYESAALSTIKFTNVLGNNSFVNDISLNSTGSISLNADATSTSVNFGILGCGGGITFESKDHGIILNSNDKAIIKLGKDTYNEGLEITVNGILSMKKSSTSDPYFYVNYTGSTKRFEIGPISKLSVYDNNKMKQEGFTTVITMYSENQSPPYTVMTFAQGVLVNVDYKENP